MGRAQKILDAMSKKNIANVRELSRLSGVPYTTIKSMLEKDLKNTSIDTVIKICRVLDIPVDALDDEDVFQKPQYVTPKFVKIPIIGKIACGNPIDSEENVEGYTFEMAQGLPNGDLYAVVASGESMQPTIKNGAHVIIKKQTTVDDGQIAAVRFRESGEITLKRVKRQGNIMLLIADNKEYEPIIVTHDNPADIVGRAIRITTNL